MATAPKKKQSAKGRDPKERAAARAELAEAKANLAASPEAAEIWRSVAALAALTLGETEEAREHIGAIVASWKKKKAIEFDDLTFGQLALVSLVDRRPIKKLVDRVSVDPQDGAPYAVTAVRLLAGAPPYPEVEARGLTGQEKRTAKLLSAVASGDPKRTIAALSEFVQTRKSRRPSVLLTALVKTSGLSVASLPAEVRSRLCDGFV